MTFSELNLLKNIQQALTEEGYTNPTPIQQQAIPIILEGTDLVGCAQTGTGKTAAFAIPIINYLHRLVGSSAKKKNIRTLVVTPTRELAIQIDESFNTYGKYTNIRSMVVFGGVSQVPQVDQLKKGIDILIATPGRLLDLHKQGFIDLDHLHFLVCSCFPCSRLCWRTAPTALTRSRRNCRLGYFSSAGIFLVSPSSSLWRYSNASSSVIVSSFFACH